MSEKKYKFVGNKSSLSEDFLRLLDHSGQFSDAVLQCNGVEIPVHKCILSARSPVFCAMFKSQMQEGLSGNVNIVDIELDVLQVMLKYVYSGKTGDSVTNNFTADLLIAADKYGLQDLKRICTNELKSILSVRNMFDIYILGDLHDVNLKEHAKEFISRLKLSVIEETEEWESLQEEYPKLAIEILKSIVNCVQDRREEKTFRITINSVTSTSAGTFSLDVKGTDTIQNVKKKISDKQFIPPEEQILYYLAPTLLDENETLSDYQVQENSTFKLIRTMKIFVKLVTGKEISLQVDMRTTIKCVKKMIEDKEGICLNQQRLLFNKKYLEDGRSLKSYQISHKCTLLLSQIEEATPLLNKPIMGHF